MAVDLCNWFVVVGNREDVAWSRSQIATPQLLPRLLSRLLPIISTSIKPQLRLTSAYFS
jgi:hypothetical protein